MHECCSGDPEPKGRGETWYEVNYLKKKKKNTFNLHISEFLQRSSGGEDI